MASTHYNHRPPSVIVVTFDSAEGKATLAELRAEMALLRRDAAELLHTLKAAERIAGRLSPHPAPQQSPFAGFASLLNFPTG